MHPGKQFVVCVLTAGLLSQTAGCGSGYPETAEVRGRITVDGAPLASGRIMFWPANGRPALAEIDAEGKYALTSYQAGDGAMPGSYKVTIKATRARVDSRLADVPDAASTAVAARNSAIEWLVSRDYENRETSPLTADVTPGLNEINFDVSKLPPRTHR